MCILSSNLCVTIGVFIVIIGAVKGEISSSLQKECLNNAEKRVDIMLELFPVDKSKFSLIPEKFIESLKFQSWKSQRPVISAVENLPGNFGVDISSFWIANRLGLKNVSCGIISDLSKIPGVETVRKEVVAHLHTFGDVELADWETSSKVDENTPQWGVTKMEADLVWSHTGGEGVIVANIDTGVRFSHECLQNCFRGGEYGFLDGIRNSSAVSPNDDHGHGTHTMGSICGSKGIGVAPGAKGMACKACDKATGCSETGLLTCGEWITCPYSKKLNGQVTVDCSKSPKIVSCSWGTDESDSRAFYNEIIDNWKKCGIIAFFSVGNSGPSCETTKSPADQGQVISVGATTKDDTIANFSSRGPSPFSSGTKPEIVAPGHKILSAWKKNDTSYATISGTSMSCPHAAGMAALLLAKNPNLTFTQVLTAMSNYAHKPDGETQCDTCSGTCSSNGKLPYPNNIFGSGRIAAYNTYMAI